MAEEDQGAPDWQGSDNWDERQWEKALKYSDDLAAKYFRLLGRYGDLPDAEEFIATKLGDTGFLDMDEMDPGLAEYESWRTDDGSAAGNEGEGAAEVRGEPGDSLYYETCPVFDRSRQLALGWCNIYSSVLRPGDRMWGLQVLFCFGRILSYLALSIGDGTFERPTPSIAFVKRALQQLNTILGELDSRSRLTKRYAATMNRIRELLLGIHDLMVTYLADLRKRQAKGQAGG